MRGTSTTSTSKPGIGIIGLGMASLPHAKSLLALREQQRVDIRAAWSPSKERREAFRARFNIPTVNSLEQILDDDSIESVLLLTPPNARKALVTDLAARGKHILMEKPVERSSAAARDIVDICEGAGITLAIMFQFRFRQSALTLRQRLDAGALGSLQLVNVQVPWWREQSYYDEPGRGSYARDGGGVLISQAIHSLDLMLSFTGPVDSVAAVVGTTAIHRMESEDFVAAGLRFANGALGALMATTAQFPGDSESLVLSGTLGTARLTPGELHICYQDGREERVGETASSGGGADPMDFPHEWHQRLIEDFLDAVAHARTPATNARDVLGVHELIDKLLAGHPRNTHEGI